ncbi:MAG: hypothetical protein ABR526_13690 [Chthoniobacterales bacterium]
MFYQIISLIGAALILAGYLALQFRRLASDDFWFNLINFVGSSLLAWVACIERQSGFIALEGAWAVLSLAGMLRRKRVAD